MAANLGCRSVPVRLGCGSRGTAHTGGDGRSAPCERKRSEPPHTRPRVRVARAALTAAAARHGAAAAADVLGDLHVFDLAALAWTDLTEAAGGARPSPRAGHGFAAANGKLYVFGGYDGTWVSGAGGRDAPCPSLGRRGLTGAHSHVPQRRGGVRPADRELDGPHGAGPGVAPGRQIRPRLRRRRRGALPVRGAE